MSRPYLNEVLANAITATLTTPSYKLVDNTSIHKVIIKSEGSANGTVVIKGQTANGLDHDLHIETVTAPATTVIDYDRPIYKIGAVVPTYTNGTFTIEYEGSK